ncbi:VanZ family protein [Neobacillus vireti]|uniref:VanZ family protein n=1 Tax=Neobacillus vireti TaxID=220686 RepID=UPI0030000B0F
MITINSWYILLPVFILFLLSLIIGTRKKIYRAGQYFLLITLAIYLLALIHLVFFPLEVYLGQYKSTQPLWQQFLHEFNFIPVLTIDLSSFVLNVILFIPFGVYLPLLSSNIVSVKKAAKYGFFLSLSIEILQFIIEFTLGSGRIEDINDIIANTLGAAVGFIIVRKLVKIKPVKELISKFSLSKTA